MTSPEKNEPSGLSIMAGSGLTAAGVVALLFALFGIGAAVLALVLSASVVFFIIGFLEFGLERGCDPGDA